MNSKKYLLVFTVVFATSLLSHAQSVTGVMMVVKGDIKVTTKDGKTEAAKVGKKVSSGDTIVAGPDSRAKIVMADKNVINISPDSKIVIEKYENDGKDKKNVELNVLYGKVRASVEQKYDGDKSKFNVKTPSAVAGVRGTDFLTGYNPSTKKAQIITFSGSVAVGQPGPGGTILNPVFVQPGQMTQAGSGAPPEAPTSLPKEDLNKMNNETKAETAPSKQDTAPSTSNEMKKEDKKEELKEENTADKPVEKRDDKAAEKKEDKKVDDKKTADKSPEKSPGERTPASEGKERSESAGRQPNSNSGSLISGSDLPGGPSGTVMMPPPLTTGLPPRMNLPVVMPPPSLPTDFIRATQKTRVNINLAPQ